MYVNWNDFELLYLIHESIEVAKKVMYHKYTYLIHKLYVHYALSRVYPYADFLQEGLLCLETAIQRFNRNKTTLFYSFFISCLKHRIYKIFRSYKMEETVISYDSIDIKDDASLDQFVYQKIVSQYDPLQRSIIESCILRDETISSFARKRNLNYYKIYRLYQKIKDDLEKILTNLIK